MKINNIGNNIHRLSDAYKKANKEVKKDSKESVDKLDISKEARELHTRNLDSKDFAVIRERINSGFYNSDKVISKVAEAILREFA